MKFLYFTDIHLINRNPGSRVDDYKSSILDKLIQIKDIANKSKVDYVFCGGDVFHSSVITLEYTVDIVSILKKINAPIYVVYGNHDIRGHSIETKNSSMLGILEAAGVIKAITSTNPLVIKEGNKNIVVEGKEYYPNIDTDPTYYSIKQRGDYNISLIHGMVQVKPVMETINHTLIDDIPNAAELNLCGHEHKGFGIVKNKEGKFFVNIGSVSRVDCSSSMKKHKPSILLGLLESDLNLKLKVFNLKVKPFEEVFNTSKIDIENAYDKQKFVNIIEEAMRDKDKSLDYMQHINNLDENLFGKDVVDTIKSFVSKAKDKTEKDDLTEYIKLDEKIWIKSVELTNFKSHKKSKVEFNKQLNIIIGNMNSGKSSILLAIQWVLHDNPKGTAFIRTGAKKCEVKLELSNGTYIRKTKTKTASSYFIGGDGLEEKEFKGFGNNLPTEIINTHQIPLINLYKDKKVCLNFGNQLDGLFLVNNTGSERAEAIGKLTKTDIIDKAMDLSTSSSREVKSKLNMLNKEKTKLENDYKVILAEKSKYEENLKLAKDLNLKINKLISLKDNINKLFAINQRKENINNEINNLNLFIDKANSIKEISNLITITENIEKLINLNSKKSVNDSNILQLESWINDYSNMEEVNLDIIINLNNYNKLLYKSLEIREKIEEIGEVKELSSNYDMDNLITLFRNISELNQKLISRKRLKNQYSEIYSDISSLEDKLENIETEVSTLNQEMLKYSCPECGRPLTEECLEYINNK